MPKTFAELAPEKQAAIKQLAATALGKDVGSITPAQIAALLQLILELMALLNPPAPTPAP